MSKPSRAPMPWTTMCSGRLAVTLGSFWRSEPAAALRGLAKGLLAGLDQPGVELLEVLHREVDLAADLDERRDTVALQPVRDLGDGPDVGRDVLAGAAVAAGGGAGQPAVLVGEVDGEAVDLELAQEVVARRCRRPWRRARPRRPAPRRRRRCRGRACARGARRR